MQLPTRLKEHALLGQRLRLTLLLEHNLYTNLHGFLLGIEYF